MNDSKILIFTIFFIMTISTISCKKLIKHNNINNHSNNDNIVVENINDDHFDTKYLKEGFIKSSVYRIVLISEKESGEDQESIKQRAEKRTFVSLQKYLRSENRLVNKNCQANLLNMINLDGKFSKKTFKNYNNTIYYLEIKRRNLKKHLYSICER